MSLRFLICTFLFAFAAAALAPYRAHALADAWIWLPGPLQAILAAWVTFVSLVGVWVVAEAVRPALSGWRRRRRISIRREKYMRGKQGESADL